MIVVLALCAFSASARAMESALVSKMAGIPFFDAINDGAREAAREQEVSKRINTGSGPASADDEDNTRNKAPGTAPPPEPKT